MAIAAKDAMSHGATFSVAKLAFESTTFPLLMVGCRISLGFFTAVSGARGLMRDDVGAVGCGDSGSGKSDCGDNLRLFLECSPTLSIRSTSEASLAESDDD